MQHNVKDLTHLPEEDLYHQVPGKNKIFTNHEQRNKRVQQICTNTWLFDDMVQYCRLISQDLIFALDPWAKSDFLYSHSANLFCPKTISIELCKTISYKGHVQISTIMCIRILCSQVQYHKQL